MDANEKLNKFEDAWLMLINKIKSSEIKFQNRKALRLKNFPSRHEKNKEKINKGFYIQYQLVDNSLEYLIFNQVLPTKDNGRRDIGEFGFKVIILKKDLYQIYKDGFDRNEDIEHFKDLMEDSRRLVNLYKDSKFIDGKEAYKTSYLEYRKNLREIHRIFNLEKYIKILFKYLKL